jgi:hypothetical protein
VGSAVPAAGNGVSREKSNDREVWGFAVFHVTKECVTQNDPRQFCPDQLVKIQLLI